MAGRGRVDKQLVERLRTVPLFSGCSTRELASLSQFLKVVDFPAGREIVKEGNTGTGLHVLLEGETKVVVGDRTRQRLHPADGISGRRDSRAHPVVVVLELPGRAQAKPGERSPPGWQGWSMGSAPIRQASP